MMASTIFLRVARKRPWTTFGASTVGLCAISAVGVEAYADRQERLAIEHGEAVTTIGRTADGDGDGGSPHQLPRVYDRTRIRSYWMNRPISILQRFGQILWELGPVAGRLASDKYFPEKDESHNQERDRLESHASLFREALTNLGPAWVKGGQQLAIRPDLVPPVVLKELQKLCDSVRPVPDCIALQLLRDELGVDDLAEVFSNVHLVASASLGQVYQARLVEAPHDTVAIKVQRPGMRKSFSLDLFLLQQWGDLMDGFTSVFTQQAPYHRALFDSFSNGSYSEMDYENEARNQKLFQRELKKRGCKVKVPNVYDELTTERVLTTEWIQGIKLADSSKEKIRELIPVGVELFLTQLLDIGTFHADPHPGNLLVTDDEGILCLLDFGLTAEVDAKARKAMTKAIVHLLWRDFDSLVSEDAKELGFLPEDYDTSELKPILTKVLTGGVLESSSNLRKRRRKLQEISNELNDIFFHYPFQVPPFFALVTRGLGLLEGIALTGDPEFDIFRASAPYARRRAVDLMGRHMTSRRRRRTTEPAIGS